MSPNDTEHHVVRGRFTNDTISIKDKNADI
jgi:hypothetical protein